MIFHFFFLILLMVCLEPTAIVTPKFETLKVFMIDNCRGFKWKMVPIYVNLPTIKWDYCGEEIPYFNRLWLFDKLYVIVLKLAHIIQ